MVIKRSGTPGLTSFLANVEENRIPGNYRKSQILFSQGDVADAIFYIQKGKVKVTVLSEQGKEAVIAILGVGDFCGEGCMGGQTVRMGSAVTMTECVAVRMEKLDVIRMIQDDQEFADLFTTHLLARNIRIEADLVDQLFNSSEKRLARLLLLLANFGKDTRPELVIAKISQELSRR